MQQIIVKERGEMPNCKICGHSREDHYAQPTMDIGTHEKIVCRRHDVHIPGKWGVVGDRWVQCDCTGYRAGKQKKIA